MASSKRVGFFWGEEKITVIEFDKNTPGKIVSASLGSRGSNPSPFSSNLTEEIQIIALLQKLLQDNQIKASSFYVSLPMKEIILRSFIIPFVKPDEVQNAIKFEAKKYVPFDMQDLSFVFHTLPISEGTTRRLQVIFFAVRKETLGRYERIFKQVNAEIAYCEPHIVSLSKTLLYKKEIKPVDHLAFLVLDKNSGRISFIDKGIPQFIREFPINASPSEESDDSATDLNARIINEVGNSFDFYARQFNGERIEHMLVSSEFVQKDLMATLEKELKVSLRKFSSQITAGPGASSDMDAVYALGACVAPPIDSLAVFNFLGGKPSKSSQLTKDLSSTLNSYKEVILVFVVCAAVLAGSFVFFQTKLKQTQQEYNQLRTKEGASSFETQDVIQGELQQNTSLLDQYKNIKTKSDVATIILKLALHLPKGVSLSAFSIKYNGSDGQVAVYMGGSVSSEDPDEQIIIVNQMYSDIKNDKDLSQFFKNVKLGTLTRQIADNRQVTGFSINGY